MTYFQDPSLYQRVFTHKDLNNKIYSKLMDPQRDLAELLLDALDVIKETNSMPKFEQKFKSESTSNIYRKEGNNNYVAGKYLNTLKYYNLALLYAPLHSKCMLLAYSNRSALFHKTKNYTASLNDIEVCLKIGCTDELLDKLTKRKKDCSKNLYKEHNRFDMFSERYFWIEGKRHSKIPCISNDVDIIVDQDTGLPRVTAAKDIKIGTVVGVEKAFTTLLNPMNQFLSCYYCHRMPLNLVPCSSCVYALFCDEECKNLCMKESHSVECHMMELLTGGFCGPYSRITFRTIIKTKLMCSTWKEFIEASYKIGEERMKNSSIEEIFDGSHKFSMLNFVELREMKISAKFNFAFMCATFVHYLTTMPFFLPIEANDRNEAIRALARMTLSILLKFYNKVEIDDVGDDRRLFQVIPYVPNYGYFGFTSKLRQECEANLLVLGLNNRVALVAVQPIKKGTELTISYIDHAYDYTYSPMRPSTKERALALYRFAKLCDCAVCRGNFTTNKEISESIRKQLRRWTVQTNDVLDQGEPTFKLSCDMLSAMHRLVGTKEHQAVYTKFRSILAIYQCLETKNYTFVE